MYTAYADGGVEPKHFPEAPTVAVPIALEKAGLKPEDIALWEVNEAFSVVVRIVEKVLGVDPSKINCFFDSRTEGWRVRRCWYLQWGSLFLVSFIVFRTYIKISGWRRISTCYSETVEQHQRDIGSSSPYCL